VALYRVEGGVDGNFQVPANRWCTGISAFAAEGISNATIQVNGEPAVPIPTGGVTNLSPPLGSSKAPLIVFTNTAGFGIETVE
jgi:hypothetical protein